METTKHNLIKMQQIYEFSGTNILDVTWIRIYEIKKNPSILFNINGIKLKNDKIDKLLSLLNDRTKFKHLKKCVSPTSSLTSFSFEN